MHILKYCNNPKQSGQMFEYFPLLREKASEKSGAFFVIFGCIKKTYYSFIQYIFQVRI